MGLAIQKPAGVAGGLAGRDRGRGDLSCLLLYGATDVDDIVGDDAEPDPTVHSDKAFVAATLEAVSPLDYADASFATGAPFLAVAEPALSLLSLAFWAFG